MKFNKLTFLSLFAASSLFVLVGCGSEPTTTVIEQDEAAIQQMQDYEAAMEQGDEERG